MCFGIAFFFGGWLAPFGLAPSLLWFILKIVMVAFLYVLVRAALPRFRYDLLMNLGWLTLLPITFSLVFFYASLLWLLDGLPLIMDTMSPFLVWANCDLFSVLNYYQVGSNLRLPVYDIAIDQIGVVL